MDENLNDKCFWLLEIFFISFISLSFGSSSLTTYITLKSDYLPRQYQKNWNMNYLVDVSVSQNDICPEGYESKIIGKWSGFDGGCYCSNNQTNIQIATDTPCSDTLEDIFTCYPLIKYNPIEILRYKGFSICLKRSEDNYFSLFGMVNKIYGEGSEIFQNIYNTHNNGSKGDQSGDLPGNFQGNSQNFPSGNSQNFPSGNSQNFPSGNSQNFPSGNSQNFPSGSSQNFPSGNSQNFPSGSSQNFPSGSSQRPGSGKNIKQRDINLSEMKYSEYIKILLNSAPPNYLNEEAIMDIKFINTTLFNSDSITEFFSDLTDYEEKKITNDYSMYILRLRSIKRPINILDLNKVLVDVHLYNELWCGYLDLSSTYLKSKFSKEDINYGDIDYCEQFYFWKNSTLSYNDNYINTIPLSFEFDKSVSVYDFYDYNGITDFYKRLKTRDPSDNPDLIKNSMYGNFEPILIGQKYFFGIGCLFSKSPPDHISVLGASEQLIRLTGAITSFCVINIILLFVFICSKIRSCVETKKILTVIIFLFSFISLLVSLSVDLISRQNILYLKDYMIYCQTDFTDKTDNNAFKTTGMEYKYFEGLIFTYRLSGTTSFCLFITNIFLILYIMRICRVNRNISETERNGNSARNIFENAQNQPKEIEINIVNQFDKNSVQNQNNIDKNLFGSNAKYNDPNYGFEFSEKDQSAASVRDNSKSDVTAGGITDRSNINFNK